MKRLLVLTFLISSFANSQVPTWSQISSFDFQWKKHQPSYRFILEVSNWHEAGDCDRIRIIPPGNKKEYTLVDSDGLVKISTRLDNKKLQKRNLSHSDYLYFSPDLTQPDGTPALILFDWAYASDPGRIHILQLDHNCIPYEAFSHDFLIIDFSDLDGDGRKEMIGLPALSEMFGKCYESYNPRYVYKYSGLGATPFQYSLKLSKKYNFAHYYGWMGPHYSEDIVVVHCAPGKKKPVIMYRDDADKLFEK